MTCKNITTPIVCVWSCSHRLEKYLNFEVFLEKPSTLFGVIMSLPLSWSETYCFPPRFCLSVGLSVHHKIVLLYNLITAKDILMKLHTFVKHIETTCHADEP